MVKEVMSAADFRESIAVPNLVVVDYYATWCGPCQKIAPFIEQLSRRYPEVVFLKVGEHNCQDVIMSQGVRAFPTFQFFINKQVIDELKGANPTELENKVNQHLSKGRTSAFSGTGATLGGSTWNGVGMPPGSEREARLKALGQTLSPQAAAAPAPTAAAAASAPAPSQSGPQVAATEEDEEEAVARAIALSMNAAAATGEPQSTAPETQENQWDEEMVPVPVNEESLTQLLEMGITDVRARKGLVHGGNVEGAVVWISEHQDDPDIDQPYMVKKSDTIPKTPLTEEEKAAKLAAYKEKVERIKKERELKEKEDEIRREKERRERGQKMAETEEERTRNLRKIEADKIRREKMEAKLERERIKAELARDKELRKLNNGVLPSVLGVDGYNPSAVSTTKADAKRTREEESGSASSSQPSGAGVNPAASAPVSARVDANPVKKTVTASNSVQSSASAQPSMSTQAREEIIDSSIATIGRYRTGGDGGQAFALLLLFLKNIRDNPTEQKYKAINMESKAYKAKLGPLVGPAALLKAVGFTHRPEEGKLYYEHEDMELLKQTIDKVTAAEESYRQQGGGAF